MVNDRSITTDSSKDFGIVARNSGNRAWTASTVWMTFAVGCLVKISKTEGLPFFSPVFRRSSTESTASPKSPIVTGAPL